jgi:hypothetical protein
LPARRRFPAVADFLFATFSFGGGCVIKRKKGCKPDESKTVHQWGLLGRIPVEGALPSYIWDIRDGPQTIYFHEKDTRAMTEEEKEQFLEDTKGHSAKYVRMFSGK